MSERSRLDTERDPAIDRIYQAAGADEPAPEMDAAILAAAHRAVGARPRPAGHSWIRSWRGAMSVAAVLVLSVSLVLVMREEAPDVVSPLGSEAPPAAAGSKLDYGLVERKIDESDARSARPAEPQTPRSVGLKPSNGVTSSGLAMPAPAEAMRGMRAKDGFEAKPDSVASADVALAKRRESVEGSIERKDGPAPAVKAEQRIAQLERAKETAASPPARVAESAVAKQSAPTESAGRIAEPVAAPKVAMADEQRAADIAKRNEISESRTRSVAENAAPAASGTLRLQPAAPPVLPQAKPAPMHAQSDRDLAPDKWLERIEELRKQGRIDDARASLAEFRKRYPDFKLPETLRNLAP